MTDFTGVYKLQSADNWAALLKEIGVDEGLVEKLNPTSGQFAITCNDGTYTLTQSSDHFNREMTFELGVEFDDKHLDGSPIKSLIIADGNKLIQTTKADDKELKVVREFNGNVVNI
ncbi:unnamed protein product, partial [Oppiella nova]